MAPTYPGGGQRLTVDAALQQPRIMSRAIGDLTLDRFVADVIFARGTADQVASGVAVFGRSESRYMNRDVEEVSPRSRYPRAGWTTELFAAFVRKYGLETPIADETRRRNAMDELGRSQRRLANSMVKFVDGVAISLLLSDAGVQTQAGSGNWTTAATDIISDVANARAKILNVDEGYEPDVMIIHPDQELDLMLDADIRNALPREGQAGSVQTGRPVPILGLREIRVTNRMTAGTAVIVESNIVGTIADEAPLPGEGYQAYNPGGGFAPVYVKVYREEGTDETIVRAARFPAMWLAEPKAAVKITGIG